MNKFISYLVYQTRKARVDIIYSAVRFSTIDKRLRDETDALIFPSLFIDNIEIKNPETITREKMNEFIKNNCEIEIRGLFLTDYESLSFRIKNITNYFKYYSSYEIIVPEIS